MSEHRPNDEQRAIIGAFRDETRPSMVVEALAGTGKTSTLEMLAKATPGRRMLYVAYNKAIQVEASKRFPRNVTCKTSHGLAYGTIGRNYAARLNAARVSARQTAQFLGISKPLILENAVAGGTVLQPSKLAQLVSKTADRFCHSADSELGAYHVPWVQGLSDESMEELREVLLPFAQAMWNDMISPDGRCRFTHDSYLKLYQLSQPRLPYSVILLDEAQDSNPCVSDLVMSQKGTHQILLGDQNQPIYGWRAAPDPMTSFAADVRLPLTGSYRFGPQLAEEANRWLELLQSGPRLRGYRKIATEIDPPELAPDAVLCRTNG